MSVSGISKWTPKNRARGNRKTLKRPKMMSKVKFRNLKLKSMKNI